MGRAMCCYQSSKKTLLRKPFGFSKAIAWSCNPIPSDFNNHQIASEKLNPSISTNPPEGNQFREISTEANEPSSSWMACEKSWRHCQKTPSCFRKEKEKYQSSQILASSHSPCRRNTNISQVATNHSHSQAVKAEEENLSTSKMFGRIYFSLLGMSTTWMSIPGPATLVSFCSLPIHSARPLQMLGWSPARVWPEPPTALPKAWWLQARAAAFTVGQPHYFWGQDHLVPFLGPRLQLGMIPSIFIF